MFYEFDNIMKLLDSLIYILPVKVNLDICFIAVEFLNKCEPCLPGPHIQGSSQLPSYRLPGNSKQVKMLAMKEIAIDKNCHFLGIN